jgi:hypothetical protein
MVTAGAVLWALGHPVLAAVPLGLAVVVGVLALVAPSALATFETLVARAGQLLGNALGAVALALMYCTAFTFGGLWLRLRGIDPLNRRFPTAGRSNWIERVPSADPALYAKQYSGPHGRST